MSYKKLRSIFVFIVILTVVLDATACKTMQPKRYSSEDVVPTEVYSSNSNSDKSNEKVKYEDNKGLEVNTTEKETETKAAGDKGEITKIEQKPTGQSKSGTIKQGQPNPQPTAQLQSENTGESNTNTDSIIDSEPNEQTTPNQTPEPTPSSTPFIVLTETPIDSPVATAITTPKLTPTPAPTTMPTSTQVPPVTGAGETNPFGNQVTAYASNFLGTPYLLGGTTPSGFDDSGFVQYVFAHFQIPVGRRRDEQVNAGSFISRDRLAPGDIVFFGTLANPVHVGIYVGNNTFIHSTQTGDVLRIASLDRSDYITARRVAK